MSATLSMDFEAIKEEYKKLHDEFLRQGNLLTKHHEKGVWAPSIPKEVYKIFHRCADKDKTFLDLGSGDGIVVMIATLFFKKASGIEVSKEFYDISIKMQKKLGLNAELIFDDFYNIDFGDYDYLYIAPDVSKFNHIAINGLHFFM